MDSPELDYATEEVFERPPLARSSVVKLASGLSILLFGFVTSVATARWLGPYDKGTLSALSFLGDVFFLSVCTLGLGEAAVVLIGRKETNLQRALSASLPPLAITGILGAVGLLLVMFPAEWTGIVEVVLLEGVILILAIYMNLFAQLLNARERFVATSTVTGLRFAINAVATLAILGVISSSLTGAIVAPLFGVAVSLLILGRSLRRLGVTFTPKWDPRYLGRAVRLGLGINIAFLLMAASQRADQLVVYSLVGEAAGGAYAVALTMGLLPGQIPLSLAATTFPRLAHIDESAVWPLTAQTVRIGLIGGSVIALSLIVLLPLGIPLVFGSRYEEAVTPATILLIGGLLWSVQWILSRARAARGEPALLSWSFGTSVGVMLAMDLILIPRWGVEGAAIASVIGSVAGLVVCIVAYRRHIEGFRGIELLPRVSDARRIVRFVRGDGSG